MKQLKILSATALLLAAAGADVIRVEMPGYGSRGRSQGPFVGDNPGAERSLHHAYFNVNKRGITLDPSTADGITLWRRLLERADVVISGVGVGGSNALSLVVDAINAELEGEKLSDIEFNVFVLLLSVAGNETTRNLISGGMYTLMQHPEQLERLKGDPDNIAHNLFTYVQGFSADVRDIFDHFEFQAQIERLAKAGLLYQVAEKFAQIDLHPDKVSNMQMGLVFEELIRKFNEALDNHVKGIVPIEATKGEAPPMHINFI